MSRLKNLATMLALAGDRPSSNTALPQDELRFVVEVEDTAAIKATIKANLGEAFSLQALGGIPGFMVLRFPTLDRTLPAHEVFQVAHELRDLLQARSVEPDLGTPFFVNTSIDIGTGSTEAVQILDAFCWVDGVAPLNMRWALNVARVPQAWLQTKGKGVVIGHLDTGVAAHDELDEVLMDQANSVDFVLGTRPGATDPLVQGSGNPGHGLATASLAVSGGAGRISGVAPEATLLPIRCIQDVKVFNGAPVAAAIAHAKNSGAHVITMSLGGTPSRAMHRAIMDAVESGCIVVAASGNCVGMVVWPARYPQVVAVAGSNSLGSAWKGTSRGSSIDIAAPAEHVWHGHRTSLDDPRGGVFAGQGTSFATALVAGAAALWVAHHGIETVKQVAVADSTTVQEIFRRALLRSAKKTPGWPDRNFGPGILDADALLKVPLQGHDELNGTPARASESILSFLEEEGGEGEKDPTFDYDAYSAELAWIAMGQAFGGMMIEELETTSKTAATRPSDHLSRSVANSTDARLRGFAIRTEGASVDASPLSPAQVPLRAPPIIGSQKARTDALEAAGLPAGAVNAEAMAKRLASHEMSQSQRSLVERSVEAAIEGAAKGRSTPTDRHVLEALVEMTGRPALRVRNGIVDWQDLNAGDWGDRIYLMGQDPIFSKLLGAVGRIDAGGVHTGSGFVVGKGLVMTNRHVAQQFAAPIPTHDNPKSWELIEDGWIDFADTPRQDIEETRFRIKSVLWSGSRRIDFDLVDLSKPDVAVLEVEEINSKGVPLPSRLQIVKNRPSTNSDVFLVGYPAQPRNLPRLDGRIDEEVAYVLSTIFQRDYGTKYFSPGRIVAGRTSAKGIALVKHDSTTLGGSSGSTLFSWLDPMQVFALHFGGLTRRENYAHDISELASLGGLPSDMLDWI